MILQCSEIPKRHSHCSKGCAPFEQGSTYYTVIYKANGQWQRQDFCSQCWELPRENFKESTTLCYWESKVPKKESHSKPQHKEERALILLKSCLSSPENAPKAYILALFLARKKILSLRQTLATEHETIYLYQSDLEELFPIKKVSLSPLEIDQLQKSIASELAIIAI